MNKKIILDFNFTCKGHAPSTQFYQEKWRNLMAVKLKKSEIINLLFILTLCLVAITKGPTIYNNFKLQFSKHDPVNIERLSGELISFPVFGEKKLVIFWMIDCAPCKIEMKRVDQLVSKGIVRGDQVIAINFVDTKEQIMQYLKDQPFQYLIALDHGGKVADQFRVNSTPTIFLIDDRGGIEWATSGLSPTLDFRVKIFFKNI